MTRQEFYNTKGWKRNRVAYAISRHCICERCGRPVYVSGINEALPKNKRLRYIVHHKIHLNPNNVNNPSITLDWNNLQLVCRDCHAAIHELNQRKRRYKIDDCGRVTVRE